MKNERIDPWGSIEIKDYSNVFKEFGLKPFPEEYRKNLNHLAFRRKIVIAHRDFEKVYNRIMNKKPFINMTGIASSGYLHMGHKAVIDLFIFFKNCGAKNLFGICDIDAYTSRKKIPDLKTAKEFAVSNLADVLALGLTKNDVYIQSKKEQRYYEFTFELSKKITGATFQAIYGTLDLGKVSANLLQYADILHGQLKEYCGKMPSITAIAIEQDPHIRAVRDVAKRLPYDMELPSSIYITHQPGLKEGMKMSSSVPDTAIFLRDKPEVAKKKILNSFTGGKDTVEEQKKTGGNPDICKVYNIFKFHHPDDKQVEDIYKNCKSGSLMCGNCKKICIKFVEEFLKEHQKKYKKFEPVARKMVFG
ncbi:MAG: tryptophan--tRNA ligase [Candidatus Aenigmatarchaeota archaeon]